MLKGGRGAFGDAARTTGEGGGVCAEQERAADEAAGKAGGREEEGEGMLFRTPKKPASGDLRAMSCMTISETSSPQYQYPTAAEAALSTSMMPNAALRTTWNIPGWRILRRQGCHRFGHSDAITGTREEKGEWGVEGALGTSALEPRASPVAEGRQR